MKTGAWFAAVALLTAAIHCAASAQEVIVIDPRDPPPRPEIDPGKDRSEFPERMSAGRCTGAVCRIAVRVNGDCTILVEPEWVFVTGKDVKVLWEIRSPGFVFDEVEGIGFKPEYNRTYVQQFQDGKRLDRRTWHYRDLNTEPGAFRYNVALINERTGQACRIDPGLVNDWP